MHAGDLVEESHALKARISQQEEACRPCSSSKPFGRWKEDALLVLLLLAAWSFVPGQSVF